MNLPKISPDIMKMAKLPVELTTWPKKNEGNCFLLNYLADSLTGQVSKVT